MMDYEFLMGESANMRSPVDARMIAGGIYVVTINRPEKRNAMNQQMIVMLTDAFEKLPADARVAVLRGTGSVFSAGADLNYMREQVDFSLEENQQDAHALSSLFRAVANCPVPTYVISQGAAIGGGLGLLCCGDIVLSTKDCKFATSEVRLGILPGVIGPYLIRKLGIGFASEFMLTGRVFESANAHRIGLLNHLCSESELPSRTRSLLNEALKASPKAARKTKELILKCSPLPEFDLEQFTEHAIAELRIGSEGQHGLECFFEKKKPDWSQEL